MKHHGPIRGKAGQSGHLLRNLTALCIAGNEAEVESGFFEVDTVARCGSTSKGNFHRSVNFTDIHTSQVSTTAILNNAHVHIRAAFDSFVEQIFRPITSLDCDNCASPLAQYRFMLHMFD